MYKGVLPLLGLALAALACGAVVGAEIASPTTRGRPDAAPALSPSGPPIAGPSQHVPDMVHQDPVYQDRVYQDTEVVPARYIAQHPDPSEPLGFSGARFQPHAGPVVDPAATPGVFDVPVEAFHESPDPYAPAPAVSSGDWLRNSHWYTEQSVAYLSRSFGVRNNVQLARDFTSSIEPSRQDRLAVPPDMGYEPGLRSTLGRYLGRDARNRDHSVEFTFLGLTHWQFAESMTAQVAGGIFSTLDPTLNIPVYNQSNEQGFSQSSDFNSYEINYRIDRRLSRDRLVYTRDSSWVRQATPELLPSMFAGIRVLAVNESINYFANSSAGTGSYDVITHNNLVGLQVGTDCFFERSEWRLGGRAKAGSLVNWTSQASTVRILNNNGAPLLPNRDEFVKDHSLAFVGELSVIGEYRFRPSFGLRASYDLMWVSNLALAQNQITFFPSTPPEISDSHALFFQGVSFGLEWFR